MVTSFRAAITAAGRTLKVTNGERFIVSPMTLSAGKYIVDPSRATMEITAILSERPQFFDMIGERNASGMSKGISSQHAADAAEIELAIGDLPYRLAAKDRFMRLGTYDIYEVTGVPETDLTQLIARVAKIGKVVAPTEGAVSGIGAAAFAAAAPGKMNSAGLGSAAAISP